jgi:DNA-binding response OmpR family regulator
VIDDDSSARESLRGIFESAGHRTIAVPDAPAALRVLKKDRCDLVMLDLELPEVDGVSLCRLAARATIVAPVAGACVLRDGQ